VPETGAPGLSSERLGELRGLPPGLSVADNALFGVCGDCGEA